MFHSPKFRKSCLANWGVIYYFLTVLTLLDMITNLPISVN